MDVHEFIESIKRFYFLVCPFRAWSTVKDFRTAVLQMYIRSTLTYLKNQTRIINLTIKLTVQ
jgi:hypothetical protein